MSSYKQRVTSIKPRNNASVLLKTRRRGCGIAASDSTRALLPANKARIWSPSAALAAVYLHAQLAPQGCRDPQASGSALSLHLHPRHFLSSFSSHLSLYSTHHHLLSASETVPKKANGFSLIKGFYICHCVPRNTKQRKPLPSPLWKAIFGTIDYFYCLSRHTSFII